MFAEAHNSAVEEEGSIEEKREQVDAFLKNMLGQLTENTRTEVSILQEFTDE